MNDFTASNGIIVAFVGSSQRWTVDPLADGGDYADVTEAQMQALREFFQAEADERLGRCRTAVDPDFVVYEPREGQPARVLRESTAQVLDYHRSETRSTHPSAFESAARAYFDAHPEPKPWRDAAAGEVWLLTIDREADVPSVASSSEGGHVVFTAATGGAGGTEEIAPESNYITAGRRIFPEVS